MIVNTPFNINPMESNPSLLNLHPLNSLTINATEKSFLVINSKIDASSYQTKERYQRNDK